MINIVGLLKAFFSGIGSLFSFFRDRALMEAGRKEMELEAHRQALMNMKVSDEIDDMSVPIDVLEQLRRDKRARG